MAYAGSIPAASTFWLYRGVLGAGRLEGFSRPALRLPGATAPAPPSCASGRRGSDVRKYTVKRARHLGEIERIDEQPSVVDLSAAAGSHEAPKLRLNRAPLLRGLLLEGAERSKVTLGVHDLFHGGGTEGADQLVLQVCDAHVETEPFHLGASQVGAEAGPLETAPEVAFLSGVAETRQFDVKPLRAEQIQEPSYRLRAPNRHDGNALSIKIPTTARGEHFERALVADPLDEHDRT